MDEDGMQVQSWGISPGNQILFELVGPKPDSNTGLSIAKSSRRVRQAVQICLREGRCARGPRSCTSGPRGSRTKSDVSLVCHHGNCIALVQEDIW